MLSSELLTELHNLNRADKLRIVQLLVNDLAQEEDLLTSNAHYEVWSPYDSADAAGVLMRMLEEDTEAEHGE